MVRNTRRKGYNAENRFVKKMKKHWWRGKVERIGMSGQLKGLKGDVRLTEEKVEWNHPMKPDRIIDKTYQGECKKGKAATPKTLLNWLEKDNNDFLVLEPDKTTKQYIFAPVDVICKWIEEY